MYPSVVLIQLVGIRNEGAKACDCIEKNTKINLAFYSYPMYNVKAVT